MKFSLKFSTHTAVAALMVAGIGIAAVHPASAETAVSQLDRGFNPENGKINSGISYQSPSASPPGVNDQSGADTTVTNRAKPVDTTTAAGGSYTSYSDAEKAQKLTDSKDPMPGAQSASPASASTAASGTATASKGPDQMDHTPAGTSGSGGTQAIGGSNAPGAAETAKGTEQGQDATTQQTASGPIGATGQTMPAKFSERNAALDNIPMMAAPLVLSDAQKQGIVAAAKGQPVDFDGSAASHVPARLALGDAMTEIPADVVAGSPMLSGYKLIRTKDRVLIVNPRLRTVVGEIVS